MDRDGRLWLPSDTSGIHIIDFKTKKLYNSRNNPQQLPYLRSQSIRAFLNDEENNTLWYAPWGEGLVRYNFLTNTFQQQLFGISKKEEDRTINSIVKSGSGELLCFIGGKCYEISNTTFQYKLLTEKSLFSDPVNQVITSLAIPKPGNDQYLVGSSEGLYYLNGEKTPYTELSLIKPGNNTRMEDCTDMLISRSGWLYCTYSNNLLVVVEKTGKILRITGSPVIQILFLQKYVKTGLTASGSEARKEFTCLILLKINSPGRIFYLANFSNPI